MTSVALLLMLAAPDLDDLAAEYLAAKGARRHEILKEIAPADEIEAADVEKWKDKLVKWGRKQGPKLRKRGTNYLYDKKTKRGKYIVGGSGGGRGGLVIALHGGGEGQGDAGGAASTFGGIASKFRCVMIAPEVLEKTERGWTTSGTEEFVLELIDAAKRTWRRIPHDRIYMVGHSMGGYGSWTVGARHADLFAGLGPYAGGPTPYTVDGKPYSEVVGIEEGVLPNLRNVALHVYQSLDDPQVPPAPNIFANKRILELKKEFGGYDYRYVEVDKRGHGAPPGGHVKGFEWLYRFERNARPKYVRWQPVHAWKRMFYWLWWDRPQAGVTIEAKIEKPNEIRIDLGGFDRTGFRLFLDSELVDLDEEVVVREGTQEVFRGKVKRRLSTLLICAGEKYDAGMLFESRIDFK